MCGGNILISIHSSQPKTHMKRMKCPSKLKIFHFNLFGDEICWISIFKILFVLNLTITLQGY